MSNRAAREAHGGMFRTMLKTSGMVAISVGALLSAGSLNLHVLNDAPSGPGNLVLRAAAPTTTTTRAAHQPVQLASAPETSSTTARRRARTLGRAADSTTTSTKGSTTTTGAPPDHPTTTTRPPTTTTTNPPNPVTARTFVVRTAGRVRVRWINKRVISAVADPNDGWTLPHLTKQGPDVTLRFYSKHELVVWHAWVEAHQIKAWIKSYKLPS